MKLFLVRLITCFIPFKNLRKKVRISLLKPFRLPSIKYSLNKLVNLEYLKNNNHILNIKNSKFICIKYGKDYITDIIVETENYYEINELEILNKFLPEKPIIIDAGSNCGNHALYWANECNAQKIYCFEPIKDTFDLLKKNIEINNLNSICKLHNVALGEKNSLGSISEIKKDNIGGTVIKENQDNGTFQILSLDSLNISEKHIDFLKIDVEGFETSLLHGAVETIQKYKPIIFIEIFHRNKKNLFKLLHSLNYSLVKKLPHNNYLFLHNSTIGKQI